MSSLKVLALTGGVGGAKLAYGLAHHLPPERCAFVVNTGDDFEHYGLSISPDLDTLTYTLSNLANRELGWGREDESWNFMAALEQLGGETWFRLGDRDLALHHARRALLDQGQGLAEITATLTSRLGVKHPIFPMTDDAVRTIVQTPEGELAFQHYFVRDRCAPNVTGFRFDGIERAQPSPQMLSWISDADAVIICPSNPYVSVDPILSLPGVRDALFASEARVIAVSPIIAGQAIKGPAAKMMRELGVPVTTATVAEHYGDLLDGFVVDDSDATAIHSIPCAAMATQSLMVTLADRIELAERVLEFADDLCQR